MFEKVIVVDCKGHMLGRLAGTVAKELLNGQKVVLVRAEETNISGSLYRNKVIFDRFLRLHNNTNPTKGPFHHRAPDQILRRTIRGMIPHKTARGAAAMKRLIVKTGCPAPYDKQKKQVVPQALKTLRIKPGRAFCRLGDLAHLAGWKHNELIKRLEAKRLTAAAAFYNTKKEAGKLKAKAEAAAAKDLAPINKQLAELGY